MATTIAPSSSSSPTSLVAATGSPVAVTSNMTIAPAPGPTVFAAISVVTDASLGPLCSWARSSSLCYGTIIPLTLWVVVLTTLLIYCFRNSNVKAEYGRLPDWTCSPLVPVSFRELTKKKQNRIFNKLRKIPVASLFARLRLGEEFLEGCAAEGVASLGDLLTLTPMFLRGLGFGTHERQMIARCIESRAQSIEEAYHATLSNQVVVNSSVRTIVDEASESNRGEIEFYVTRPKKDAMERHMDPVVAQRMSPSVVDSGLVFHSSVNVGLISEEVSRLFWDLFASQMADNPAEAAAQPMIQLVCGRREQVKVSRDFYSKFRRKWFIAQQTPVVVGIQVQSTFRHLVERFQPVLFVANQQFWLGFVLRWNQHEELKRQEREMNEAKVAATGDALLERVREGDGVTNTSFAEVEEVAEDDDELDEDEWVDAFVDDLGATPAADRMRQEIFSVRVQLVKTNEPLTMLDSLLPEDLPCNASIHDDDGMGDDESSLFREVFYDTTTRLWNDYVHEFQCGELCVFEDEEAQQVSTGMLAAHRSAMRDRTRVLLRVVNDHVKRTRSLAPVDSPPTENGESSGMAAVRQRAIALRRARGISVVWKQMLETSSTTGDVQDDQTP